MSITVPVPEATMKHAAQYVVTRHPSTRGAFITVRDVMGALDTLRRIDPSMNQVLRDLDMALLAAVLDAVGIPKDVRSMFAEDASAMIFDAEESIR